MHSVLIPPPQLVQSLPLEVWAGDGMHMVLPDFCYNSDYFKFYRNLKGRHIHKMLDNGAAETRSMSPGDLHALAMQIGANEIVVPDSIGNCDETMRLARQFTPYVDTHKFKYMGVIQGRTMDELKKCLYSYVHTGFVTTFGLPRYLIKIFDTSIRLRLVQEIKKQFGSKFAIHLLGASHLYPEEARVIESTLPRVVRSIDTSLPFVYAMFGVPTSPRFNIPRPDNYMSFNWDPADIALATENCYRYIAWCHNKVYSPGEAAV